MAALTFTHLLSSVDQLHNDCYLSIYIYIYIKSLQLVTKSVTKGGNSPCPFPHLGEDCAILVDHIFVSP